MKHSSSAALAVLLSTTGLAMADVPKVVTDIAPIHGLVSRVMDGVGEPDLIVTPGTSPHHFSMRPSNARALSNANLVVWMGHALTPWLEDPIHELGGSAHVIELLETEGSTFYEFRTGATFETRDHGDHEDHDDHDDHGHDEHHDEHAGHDDHGHDEHHDDHADHDDHEHHDDHDDHAGHDDHAHDGVDPHAWLAPANGKAWLALIAEELSELDPENATTYQANAAAGQAEIDAVVASLETTLAPVADKPFVVFHDAYQYFERSFDLSAAGAISLGDATKPSAARLAEIHETVRELGVVCIFSEPQYNKSLVHSVAEAGDIKELDIDPQGLDLELGSNFYVNLLSAMGASLASCE